MCHGLGEDIRLMTMAIVAFGCISVVSPVGGCRGPCYCYSYPWCTTTEFLRDWFSWGGIKLRNSCRTHINNRTAPCTERPLNIKLTPKCGTGPPVVELQLRKGRIQMWNWKLLSFICKCCMVVLLQHSSLPCETYIFKIIAYFAL